MASCEDVEGLGEALAQKTGEFGQSVSVLLSEAVHCWINFFLNILAV
jgi:hypothetical protein